MQYNNDKRALRRTKAEHRRLTAAEIARRLRAEFAPIAAEPAPKPLADLLDRLAAAERERGR